ncbi:MAG: AMP-binding protein [Gemmataceae bacterium]
MAAADDRAGAVPYERLLVGALTMAARFRQLPGKNVGVLLPSSVACDVALMALYLADKLPVVLNWTTGPANLAHAARLMELQHVVTSKAFVDRLGVEVAGTSYVYLETVRKEIRKLTQMLTLLKVRYAPSAVRRQVPRPDPDSPAVVLFTSGSEKAPKAVPLTHRNLLGNQRDGLKVLNVSRKDSILGFLPAFHSFGMSITGLFPLLAGMRVVRHPDPTDARARAQGGAVQTDDPGRHPDVPELHPRTPDRRAGAAHGRRRRNAARGIHPLRRGGAERRRSGGIWHYGVFAGGGGESAASDEARDGGQTAAVGGGAHRRAGRRLPVRSGERGLLLVGRADDIPRLPGRRPTRRRSANWTASGWYVTGDLVEQDADGYLRFAGRLKRFVKAGGEMISLPALEEPFAALYPPTKDGPRVAVEGVELDGGGRRIALFTTEPLTLRDANDLLLKHGFHGVMRLDEVRQVATLPVLGTGKTDYKVLRKELNHQED